MKTFLVLMQGVILLALSLTSDAHANDNSQPLFESASSIMVDGQSFDWMSAFDDGTLRYDTYSSGSGTATVTTRLIPGSLALVQGTGGSWSFEGFCWLGGNFGQFNPLVVAESLSGSLSFGSFSYPSGSRMTTNTVNLLADEHEVTSEDTWTSSTGTYIMSTDAEGDVTWVQSHSGTQAHEDPQTTLTSISLLGELFSFAESKTDWSWLATGDEGGVAEVVHSSVWTDRYDSPEGGVLLVKSGEEDSDEFTTFEGHIGHIGEFKGAYAASASHPHGGPYNGLAGIVWQARLGPAFAPAHIWLKHRSELNYRLLNWTGGQLNSDGSVVDTFQDATQTNTLTVSGQPKNFTDEEDTQASLNGVVIGAFHPNWFEGYTPVTDDSPPWDVQMTDPGTLTEQPFFVSATTLWVNGNECNFSYGHIDSYGGRVDIYQHGNVASLHIMRSAWGGGAVTVRWTASGITTDGSFADGVFSYAGVNILDYPPEGTEALWVRGCFYKRSQPGSNTFTTGGATPYSLTLQKSGPTAPVEITGADGWGTFAGAFPEPSVNIFLINDESGNPKVPVMLAESSGLLQLSTAERPESLPPALWVSDSVWVFLGVAADDSSPAGAHTAAYYGSANVSDSSPHPWLIKIRNDSQNGGVATVTRVSYADGSTTSGTYHPQTHLLQTSSSNGLPLPLYSLNGAEHDWQLWDLPQPDEGWPATFLVGGQVWRYAGLNNGRPVYQGDYYNQLLTIGEVGPDGKRLVTVVDPVGGNTHGRLNNARGSVRLRDGRLVFSGDFDGDRIDPTLDEDAVHTIAADLDITGNLLTFGSLQGAASFAGVTWQFEDGGQTASLHNMLGRQTASWVWSHAAEDDMLAPLPAMRIDASSKLILLDPGDGSTGIVLDAKPNGVSSIRGTLRVRPGGDVGMSGFQQGPTP